MSDGKSAPSVFRPVALVMCEIAKFLSRNGGSLLFMGGYGALVMAKRRQMNRKFVEIGMAKDDIDNTFEQDSLDSGDSLDGFTDARSEQDGSTVTPLKANASRLLKEAPPTTSPISKHRASDFTFPELSKQKQEDGVLIIGVAGGSGSGKTTYSQAIYKAFGAEAMTYIQHDSYYKDLRHLHKSEREKINFDHPDSLDTELLIEHIKLLKAKKRVEIPTYDFSEHSRGTKTTVAQPRPLILVEGILIFENPRLYELMDIKIFLRTDDDIRLVRRMRRDIEDRGRTLSGVVEQYLKTVRPMHVKFVEPSMRNADIIVPEGMNNVALDLVVHRLNAYVHNHHLLEGKRY